MTPVVIEAVRWTGISIHMPHTWHDPVVQIPLVILVISIHMPHTWHDRAMAAGSTGQRHFNPHATYVA